MGFASFSMLIWDHVDTFQMEVSPSICDFSILRTHLEFIGRVHLERPKGISCVHSTDNHAIR